MGLGVRAVWASLGYASVPVRPFLLLDGPRRAVVYRLEGCPTLCYLVFMAGEEYLAV